MKKICFILLITISSTIYGQEWIYLKDNLEITDNIAYAQYSAAYLKDTLSLKIFQIINLENVCGNDYKGLLYTSDLNSRSGKLLLFYPSNKPRTLGHFKDGKREGMWTEYFESGQIDNKGIYLKGQRMGYWKWYFKNGQMSSNEFYENDNRKSVEMWDSSGLAIDNTKEVDKIPALSKRDKDMNKFRQLIVDNLRYPVAAQEKNISGKVFVQFCIDEDGNLINSRVIKGVNEDLDKEALRVINLAKKWIPGVLHNRPTSVSFTFPIVFKL